MKEAKHGLNCEDRDISLPFPLPGYRCSNGSPKVIHKKYIRRQNLQGGYFLYQVIFQQENFGYVVSSQTLLNVITDLVRLASASIFVCLFHCFALLSDLCLLAWDTRAVIRGSQSWERGPKHSCDFASSYPRPCALLIVYDPDASASGVCFSCFALALNQK